MKISFHWRKENKVGALFMGWDTLTLSVLPAALCTITQTTPGKPCTHMHARLSACARPTSLLGPSKRKGGSEHNVAEWFYFTARGAPGSLWPVIFQKCLYSEWDTWMRAWFWGASYTFLLKDRWANPSLKTHYMHATLTLSLMDSRSGPRPPSFTSPFW